jgi:protein phosphatase
MSGETARFESGAASHVGKVRARNEDNYLVHPESGIWAVADGMGGHDDGDLASAAVIGELRSIGRPASAADLLTRCEESIVNANDLIYRLASDRKGATIGTTVAILLAYDSYFACVWCGDSRIYRLRAGELSQLSRDHTEVQEMIEDGRLTPEQAMQWPRNVITRAIGVRQRADLEMEQGDLLAGDVFLICSDGLTGHVADEEIKAALVDHECQLACDILIEKTLDRGAHDNVTVVAVRHSPALVVPRHDEQTIVVVSELEPPVGDTTDKIAAAMPQAMDYRLGGQSDDAEQGTDQ